MEELLFEIELDKALRNAVNKGDIEWTKQLIALYCYGYVDFPSFVWIDENDGTVVIEKEGGEQFLRISHSEINEYVRRCLTY